MKIITIHFKGSKGLYFVYFENKKVKNILQLYYIISNAFFKEWTDLIYHTENS